MMIRAVAIDDEPLALKLLEVYAGRIADLELIAVCTSAAAAMSFLDKVDVMFLDINMPDMTGMEFIRQLANPPLVVFTTAYSEYAVEGFRVNAIDYLVKPFGFEEFSEAVSRVRELLALRSGNERIPVEEKVVFFQVGRQKRRVAAKDILYVESMGAYLKVFICDEEHLVVLGNFKSILDVDPAMFFRIHKSFVVNLSQIRQRGKASVTLNNGKTLPVGEAYRKGFQKAAL